MAGLLNTEPPTSGDRAPDVAGGARPGRSALVASVASALAHAIARGDLPPHAVLAERELAVRFRVSRTPVRAALVRLEEQGLVERSPRGRARVAADAQTLARVLARPLESERLYEEFARERLEGRLPDRVSEATLRERFGLSSRDLRSLLERAQREGWMDRRPGYGWEFRPVLTTLASYAQSYRFRLALEPAALREPGYRADVAELERCRAHQQRLIDGDARRTSDAALFEINSHLHEVIVRGSHNDFFIESLERVNRLRRLIEYQQTLPRDRAIDRCREHIRVIDLILAHRVAEASTALGAHLASVGPEKSAPRHAGRRPPPVLPP